MSVSRYIVLCVFLLAFSGCATADNKPDEIHEDASSRSSVSWWFEDLFHTNRLYGLIDDSSNINKQNSRGETMLYAAVVAENTTSLSSDILSGGMIMQYSEQDKCRVVRSLLEKGADPNVSCRINRHTPLDQAILKSHQRLALLFLNTEFAEILTLETLKSAYSKAVRKKLDVVVARLDIILKERRANQ